VGALSTGRGGCFAFGFRRCIVTHSPFSSSLAIVKEAKDNENTNVTALCT
jgi:hypothetical protein